MRRRIFIFGLVWALLGAAAGAVQAGPIFNSHPHADQMRAPDQVYEEDRVIAGHQGQDTTLSFRLARYGAPAAGMPLLVQVHEWGGDFQKEEDFAAYVPEAYRFVMLYFQYKPSTLNEENWWWGTQWGGACRTWAHEAVMAIVNQVLAGSLVSDHLDGATVDPNRVYLFGHSIGGTGAWQLGVRHPEVFAAIHAHSGFARFTTAVGPFEELFDNTLVGPEGTTVVGEDGQTYASRQYSDLSWWLTNYRQPGWQTPFINITAGTADDVVPPASGGDLMAPLLDQQKRAYFYFRHTDGHSSYGFVQMNWMWNFRRDQAFLAFTNRSGYGIGLDQAVTWSELGEGGINDLYAMGWDPDTMVDQAGGFQVQLTGSGTADLTPRRLQNFEVTPGGGYQYWLGSRSGAGAPVSADGQGLLTIPQVTAPTTVIIEPGS